MARVPPAPNESLRSTSIGLLGNAPFEASGSTALAGFSVEESRSACARTSARPQNSHRVRALPVQRPSRRNGRASRNLLGGELSGPVPRWPIEIQRAASTSRSTARKRMPRPRLRGGTGTTSGSPAAPHAAAAERPLPAGAGDPRQAVPRERSKKVVARDAGHERYAIDDACAPPEGHKGEPLFRGVQAMA